MATRVVQPEQELALRDQGEVPAVMEEMSFPQLRARMDKIKDTINSILTPEIDFGIVPGTSRIVDGVEQAKPSLFKSGAEKIAALFLFDAEFENTLTYSGPDSNQHLTVTSVCTLYHIPTSRRVGSGSGMCSTKESKYAERVAGRKCPGCAKENIRKSKDGGWYCWVKTGGCGRQFPTGDPSIESQVQGKVPNDKLADSYNTVIKMGEKRAKVAAVIGATGASQFVTQDLEDLEDHGGGAGGVDTGKGKPETGTGATQGKKAGGKSSGASKGGPAPESASAQGDKITPEQVQEFIDTCKELDYDPAEVLANYQQYDASIKEIGDIQLNQFRNFQQVAARKRAEKEKSA